jgi:hypothetical protein
MFSESIGYRATRIGVTNEISDSLLGNTPERVAFCSSDNENTPNISEQESALCKNVRSFFCLPFF